MGWESPGRRGKIRAFLFLGACKQERLSYIDRYQASMEQAENARRSNMKISEIAIYAESNYWVIEWCESGLISSEKASTEKAAIYRAHQIAGIAQ